ncbi:MAG: hypothetical protein ACHP9V_06880 [Terriglobales bacterium]
MPFNFHGNAPFESHAANGVLYSGKTLRQVVMLAGSLEYGILGYLLGLFFWKRAKDPINELCPGGSAGIDGCACS